MSNCFLPADILIPEGICMTLWSVVACDQYTSQPEYWQRVRTQVGDCPSTLNMILPEAYLNTPEEDNLSNDIRHTMERYLNDGVFRELKNSFILTERTLEHGRVRRGLIGRVDLEDYDYSPDSHSLIRATEGTVVSRLPPRIRVRQGAALEFPHIMILCDDPENQLLGPIIQKKDKLECLYDFELMESGGHIKGYLVDSENMLSFEAQLAEYTKNIPLKYPDLPNANIVFAMGDGNHSLATAKACWEKLKSEDPTVIGTEHPARYALVEMINIHDPALEFEPIHRIITETEPNQLLNELLAQCGTLSEDIGWPVQWYAGNESGTIFLDHSKGELAVGILQAFLDTYLETHEGSIDYIHGDDVVKELSSADRTICFLLPGMEKSQLFRGVIADGVLPRKTFSMGHANEKRFYLEGRRIR